MKVSNHIIISALLSILIYCIFRSITIASAFLLGGVFIDIDHIFDYLINFKFKFRLKHFFIAFGKETLPKIFIVLHSWELVFIILPVIYFNGMNSVALSFAAGYILHLSLDNIANKCSCFAYFFIYRLIHEFQGKYFYGKKEYRKRLKYMLSLRMN
jgi:hypothetical protein